MNLRLSVILIIFALVWLPILVWCVRANKISVKYSMVWFFSVIIIMLVGIFPGVLELISSFLGFGYLSNFIIGALITMLMLIAFVLTIIVTALKKTTRCLVEEIALLKEEIERNKKKNEK